MHAGFTPAIITAVGAAIDKLPVTEHTKVGLFTYDSTIQYYQVRGQNYDLLAISHYYIIFTILI